MNPMQKILVSALILAVILINLFRFYDLENIPAGFHVDELSAAVTVRCFSLEGTNAWGVKNGAFFTVAYGSPRPATYIWPAAVWGRIFDYTVPSLRAFSALVAVFGILGIYALGWRVGGVYTGLWSALAASISPHMFVCSRVAFESTFAASFLAWGLFFLFKKENVWSMAAAAVFVALGLYSYPPSRLFVPLLLSIYFILFKGWKDNLVPWVIFISLLGIFSVPIFQGTFSGELQSRFDEISIMANIDHGRLTWPWLREVSERFIKSFGSHLSWDFLFVKGDASTVHSTTKHGIFSWLDCAAWVGGIILVLARRVKIDAVKLPKDFGKIIILCVAGFFISIVPAALTNSEIPNSLRISLHWPLISLLTGMLIAQAQLKYPSAYFISLIVTVLFAINFLFNYFTDYRRRSAGIFNDWVVRDAQQLKTNEDWFNFLVKYRKKDYHTRYFLMNQQGKSCMESYEIWNNVYNNLGKGKRY